MSSRTFGASPKKGAPLLRISANDSSRYGTEAITRSGLAAMIWSALADHESSTMMQPVSRTSGQTSTQYLVQATSRSSNPRSRNVTVTLGWSDTTRCGMRFSGIIELYKQNGAGEADLRAEPEVPRLKIYPGKKFCKRLGAQRQKKCIPRKSWTISSIPATSANCLRRMPRYGWNIQCAATL